MLKRLKAQGITIVVSTPYMDEATLCERIALIQDGKIMSVNTPQNIIKQYPQNLYAVKAGNMSRLLHDLRSNPHIKSCNSFGAVHHVTFIHDIPDTQAELLKDLHNKTHTDAQIRQVTPTIEDCFIELMG